MTFSIVARDAATGALGVAVATSALAVGRAAPWALAGVGAVVTQAHTSRAYGARGLELLSPGPGQAAGLAPAAVLDRLTAGDPDRHTRQVAMVDATGRVAAWTGRGCLSACGHVTGEGYSAQGNTLRSRSVVPSMAEAFQDAQGRLAERLLAALRAAEEAGGDIRGRQSAAILVVTGRRTDTPWDEVTVDLRVDDAPDPVGELARLVGLQRAYESGDLETLRERAAGGVPELYAALEAARHGDRDAARHALAALRLRPGWEGVVRRMASRFPGPGDRHGDGDGGGEPGTGGAGSAGGDARPTANGRHGVDGTAGADRRHRADQADQADQSDQPDRASRAGRSGSVEPTGTGDDPLAGRPRTARHRSADQDRDR